MPELPEVETVRRGLEPYASGATISGVEVHHPRLLRRNAGAEQDFAAALTGARVRAVVRRGKFLWLELGADTALLFHLGMSGQLLIDPRPDMPRTHLRLRLALGAHDMWFVDQRTFGYAQLAPTVPTADRWPAGTGTETAALPRPVAHIARDPLDPAFDAAATARTICGRRTAIKRALLDQGVVSGIGNIYADEALWRARMHPLRATRTLAPRAARDLLGHAADILAAAVAAGGTSFDALYVDAHGRAGWFERELNVYGRAGQPCPRCGRAIVRETFMNRSSHRCPACQRRPAPAHLAR